MHLRRCWIRSLPLALLLVLPALGASAANWRDLQRVDDVAYFLVVQTSAASIERLQMDPNVTQSDGSMGTRLASLPLDTSSSAPVAFFVEPSGGLFVAYPDRIVQIDPNDPTHPQTVVSGLASGAIALYGVGSFLFVVRSAPGTGTTVQPIDTAAKTAHALVTASTRQATGFAFQPEPGGSPAHGEVFAFASDSASVVLLRLSLGSDGTVGTATESRIPTPTGAARIFPFADLTRVADAGGTVYSASDLLPLDSFAGAVTGLAFRGDVPLVLRGAQVATFTNTLEEVQVHTFPTTGDPAPPPLPQAILVQDDGSHLWAFSDDNDTDSQTGKSKLLQARAFALGTDGTGGDPDFQDTPGPNKPIELASTAFTPDGVAFDESSGILLLLDAADLRLFRWSVATQQELPAVQLPDTPRFLAISPSAEHDTIYLGYSGGQVKQMHGVGAPGPIADFADVKAPLCGLVTADGWVVTCQQGASASSTTTSTSTPTTRFTRAGRTRRGSGPGTTNILYSSFDPAASANAPPVSTQSAPLGSGIVWSPAAGSLYFLASSGGGHGSRGPQVVKLPLTTGDGALGTPLVSALTSRAGGRRGGSSVTPAPPVLPVESGGGVTVYLGSGQELDGNTLALLSASVPAPEGAGALADATNLGSDIWAFRGVGGVAEADVVTGGSLGARALFEGAPLRLFSLPGALVAVTSVLGVPTPTAWPVGSAQSLGGNFRFASTSATPLFDLAATNFSEPGSNSELSFDTITMDSSGVVGASGQIQFTAATPPEHADVSLTGSLTGSGSATSAQLHLVYSNGTLNGQPFSGTTDMKLTAFDASRNTLTGTQTVNFHVGRQQLQKSSAGSWQLPPGADGSWILDVTLSAPSGGTITGTAVLQVHPKANDSLIPARSTSIALSGPFDGATGQATLTGTSGDGASLTLTDLTALARGVTGTVEIHWLGQDRSAALSGSPR